MTATKEAAVAGLFYPGDPEELFRTVAGFLDGVEAVRPAPKAIVAPHAGYPYSGPVAASAYASLRGNRDRIRRVVMVGPAHWTSFAGLAYPTASAFSTPLGSIPVDQEALESLKPLPQVQPLDAAYAKEHSLEVQLPFLQSVLTEFSIVPLLVGATEGAVVAEVLDRLWGGDETLIVVSSDLSHFHSYKKACKIDQRTVRAVEEARVEPLRPETACGYLGIQGLLLAGARHGFRLRCVDLRNSGDTAGARDRVVGYASFVTTARSAPVA